MPPGCVGDLVEMLGTPPSDDRPKAYREAWKPAEENTVDPERMSADELFALGIKRMHEDAAKLGEQSTGRKSLGG